MSCEDKKEDENKNEEQTNNYTCKNNWKEILDSINPNEFTLTKEQAELIISLLEHENFEIYKRFIDYYHGKMCNDTSRFLVISRLMKAITISKLGGQLIQKWNVKTNFYIQLMLQYQQFMLTELNQIGVVMSGDKSSLTGCCIQSYLIATAIFNHATSLFNAWLDLWMIATNNGWLSDFSRQGIDPFCLEACPIDRAEVEEENKKIVKVVIEQTKNAFLETKEFLEKWAEKLNCKELQEKMQEISKKLEKTIQDSEILYNEKEEEPH